MTTRILPGVLALLGLVAVRVFEGHFYDPFISYFKQGNPLLPRPEFSAVQLVFHHLFRLMLNVLFSLLLVWAIFRNRIYLKVSGVLMGVVSAVALALYLFIIIQNLPVNYQLLFFIRRFAIQPLLLFLMIPTFYYLNQQKGKNLL